jgi:hypothetical protein
MHQDLDEGDLNCVFAITQCSNNASYSCFFCQSFVQPQTLVTSGFFSGSKAFVQVPTNRQVLTQ